MRIIVLDTETTGFDPKKGDRIVEVGCVEIVDRGIVGKVFHSYFNPERAMPKEAEAVHGLSDGFLADKPKFAEKSAELRELFSGAHLIAHNSDFDVKFLNNEFNLVAKDSIPLDKFSSKITDTLALSRQKLSLPSHKLDNLCDYFKISRAKRERHGALLDAELLAEVYLALTAGQTTIKLASKKALTDRIDFSQLVSTQPLAKVELTSDDITKDKDYFA